MLKTKFEHQEPYLDMDSLFCSCVTIGRREHYIDFKGGLGAMRVGDKKTFPLQRWASVRASASKYKREWGYTFSTRRRGSEIIVTRTK